MINSLKIQGFVLCFLLTLVYSDNSSNDSKSNKTVLLKYRTGIAKMSLNNANEGNYNITFIIPMLSNNYNIMPAVGYVFDFNSTKGIYLNVTCPKGKTTQTNFQCSVTTAYINKYNTIYVTYIISDDPDFIVGYYFQDISLGKSNNLTTNISIPISIYGDQSIQNISLSHKVFISGVQSADKNFILELLNSSILDKKKKLVNITVVITEFHENVLSISFGYFVWYSKNYTFSLMHNFTFSQNYTSNNSYLVGITKIKSSTPLPVGPKPPARLLSIVPSSQQSVNTPQKPKISLGESLRTKQLASRNVKIRQTQEDQDLFLQYCVSLEDGIIEGDNLKKYFQEKRKKLQQDNKSVKLFGSDKSSLGQGNQVFNSLFSTNGFIIHSKESTIDAVYYFHISQLIIKDAMGQVRDTRIDTIISNLTQNTSLSITSNFSQWQYEQILYRVPFKHMQQITCNDTLIMRFEYINYLHMGYKYYCIQCPAGQAVNQYTQQCEKIDDNVV